MHQISIQIQLISEDMSLIFNIPDELCRDWLSDWFDVKILGLLDLSLCSKRYRPYWLKMLRTTTCTNSSSRKANEWLYERKIKITKFILYDKMIALGRKHRITFHVDFLFIQSLNTTRIFGTDVTFVIINSCVYLKEFITNGNNLNVKSINPEILSNLESLRICTVILHDERESLTILSERCHQLRTFHYPFTEAKYDSVLMEIMNGNPYLTSLQFFVCPTRMPEIVQQCSALTQLSLYASSDFTTVIQALRLQHKLEYLRLASDFVVVLERKRQRLTLDGHFEVSWPEWPTFMREIGELKELQLHLSVPLDVPALSCVFQQCKFLVSLELLWNISIDCNADVSLLGQFKSLCNLSITMINGSLDCCSLGALATLRSLTVNFKDIDIVKLNCLLSCSGLNQLSVSSRDNFLSIAEIKESILAKQVLFRVTVTWNENKIAKELEYWNFQFRGCD